MSTALTDSLQMTLGIAEYAPRAATDPALRKIPLAYFCQESAGQSLNPKERVCRAELEGQFSGVPAQDVSALQAVLEAYQFSCMTLISAEDQTGLIAFRKPIDTVLAAVQKAFAEARQVEHHEIAHLERQALHATLAQLSLATGLWLPDLALNGKVVPLTDAEKTVLEDQLDLFAAFKKAEKEKTAPAEATPFKPMQTVKKWLRTLAPQTAVKAP